jgi:sugar lactone lactonase YvrE
MFVMPDGTFIVTDASNFRVLRFPANSASGTPGEFLLGDGDGNGPRQLRFPTGIFVDTARRIFVIDQVNNRIQRFVWGSREGVTVAAGGGKGNALNQLDSAMGIYVTQSGMIYVSDTKNHRVLRYGPNSVAGTVVAGGNGVGLGASQLNEPMGIWVDELSGDLYIADSRNHRIMRYREGLRSGERIAGTGFAGSDLGSLRTPTDIIVHPNGDLFICDGGNHRILRIRANTTNIAVVAGSPNGGSGSTGNLLNGPFKIFIDQAGRLWVTELGNIRISRYGLTPISSPNNYRPVLPGTHYAVLTSATGCSITTDTIRVLTGTQPAPPIARDTTACFNGPSPVINVMGNNLRWYPTATSNQGSATQPIVPTNLVTTQSLWLTQRSITGCESNRVRVNVRVAGLPNARLVVEGKSALVPGDTTLLKAQSDSSVTQFRWFYNNNPLLFSGRDLKINFSNTGNYMVDLVSPEGCIRRSPTVAITRAEPEDRSLYLFPNPARDQVNLYFSARQNNIVFVKIISSFGRVMRNERTNVNSGLNVLRVNIADLQPGSYTIQVMNNFGDLLGSRQLIKMR